MGAPWKRRLVHRNRNGTVQVSLSIHPQDKSGENVRHSRFFPKKFNMPQMSSMDATYHAAQDFIYAIDNPAPARPLVKLGNGHKEAFRILAEIFRKANPTAVPTMVPVREVG